MKVSGKVNEYFELSSEEAKKLDYIADRLEEKNKVMNLTAIEGGDSTALLHFYDSLTLIEKAVLKRDDSFKVLDLGCGAGFPSLPLAACCNNCSFTMVDSTAKKLTFIDEVINGLGLNARTVAARAEELGKNHEYRERYDIVTARGVARLNVLCEWALPLVKVGGILAAMKGKNGLEELEEAENAVALLGGGDVEAIDAPIPETDRIHKIIIIKKLSETPLKYPRENRLIKKKPL